MRYRQKPAVIEAIQWFPAEDHRHEQIEGIISEFPAVTMGDGSHWSAYAVLRMIDGSLANITPGDWVIIGVDGNKSVCAQRVFNQIYEKAG